jgi:hypothetical protein
MRNTLMATRESRDVSAEVIGGVELSARREPAGVPT